MPFFFKILFAKVIALSIYFPLAKIAYILEALGFDVSHIPLSQYRKYSFYVRSTDALDRFGTRLQQRFTKKEISMMMKDCGLTSMQFREVSPYWVAIGYKN